MRRMATCLISISLLMGLNGCAWFKPVVPTDHVQVVERNARVIFNGSESATLLVLKNRTDGKKVAPVMVKELDGFVFPILNKPDAQITSAATELVWAKMDKIDVAWKQTMSNSLNILNEYYVAPTVEKSLTSDGLTYLKAFFNGVKSGCIFVMEH